jgi:glycosyltransferase involved in cell wall biosynthesis
MGPKCLKISIVTPSFNQAAFLEETLLSVKNQNYAFTEHIVMDGGSTDGSIEILQKYSCQPGWEHLHWVSEPDSGQGDAVNKGIECASGDVIGWLNSDDRYRPGCFANVAKGFSLYPAISVLYGDYTFIDEIGRVRRIRREIEFNNFILHYLHMLYILTATTFFRREVFDEGNWIDTSYDYAMDYELILRLARKGYRFRHIPELLSDFRFHAHSKTVSHPEIGLREHYQISEAYSPILQRVRSKASKRCLLLGLQVIARGLRYSEKLLRGYYFEQAAPGRIAEEQARQCTAR